MTVFDIVLLPFPFSDLSSVKQRPGLVLAALKPRGLRPHYVVAMMTSHLTGVEFPGDITIAHWRAASLPKPTLIRLSKVVTIDSAVIRRKLGRLDPKDQVTACTNFQIVFSALLPSSRVR